METDAATPAAFASWHETILSGLQKIVNAICVFCMNHYFICPFFMEKINNDRKINLFHCNKKLF